MFITFLTRLRYVTLWLARLWGYIYRWLLNGWPPFVLWLVVVAFGVWLAEWVSIRLNLFSLRSGAWFQVWNILAIYALTGILGYVWQARKRIVVEEFVDYAAADPSKPLAKGLATLLVIKLAQLRELYQAVDEQRAIPTDVGIDRALDATINVEDVSGFLKGAVSPESKLSLGPIAFPVGNLMSLISRMVQGTRIIGSLHRATKNDKPTLILTVQKVGGMQSYSWQVDSEIIPPVKEGELEKYRLDNMVTELAYRIFADLELQGTVRWKALSAFSEGLRAYRDCLRTPKDKKLNLKRAQQKLIEALAEDTNLDVAYYNLGVVYSELGQRQTAEVAFLEAIRRNPRAWRAYYALMVNRFQCGPDESVIALGERVIELKPAKVDLAKAYHSIGLARRHLHDYQGAIKNLKKAISHAWKALCKAERSRQRTNAAAMSVSPQLETIASVCLADLAVSYGYRAMQYDDQASKSGGVARWFAIVMRLLAFRRAQTLLRQALFLNRSNANFYFELGKLCYVWERYNQAVRAYEHTVQIDPERIEFWAYLALAYTRLKQPKEAAAQSACKKVLDYASYASERASDALEKAKEAYNWLAKYEQGQRVAERHKFLQGLKKDIQQGRDAIPSLKKKLRICKRENELWEYAQISWALGQIYLDTGMPELAEKRFLKAIEKFERSYPPEIRRQRLRALLVRSLLDQGKHVEALPEAERALALDPLNPVGREILGDVYFGLNEFERAIDAWQEAAFLPNDSTIYLKIGITYFYLAQQCHPAQRKTVYQQATTSLEQVLDLCESDQHAQKAEVCYFLGNVQLLRGAYEEAISCFRISKALGFSPLTSTFYLAYAYLKSKEYDASTDLFQSLRTKLEEAKRDGRLNNTPSENASEEQWTRDEILVMAYWGLAFSYAGRDIRLEEGLNFIKTAQEHMDTLDQDKLKGFHYPASCLDCKGWILAKQGKTDEAINYLEQALSLATGAETYWHLAIAYARKLQDSSKDDPQLQFLIMQVKVYCQHVQELDLNGEFEQLRQDLLRRLEERDQREQQGKAQE